MKWFRRGKPKGMSGSGQLTHPHGRHELAHAKAEVGNPPGWARSQNLPTIVRAGGVPYQAGLKHPPEYKRTQSEGKFCRTVGAPLWDCSTCHFTQRGGGDDRPSQTGSQDLPDTHRSWGWEEAGQGQAAVPASTCKG